jgi:hypothetical protein
MTPLPVIAATAAGRLGRHLDRLHDTLEGLGERLREVVGEAVGRAVADAVREAVETLLDTPPESTTRPSYHSPPPGRQSTGLWGGSASSSWPYEREEYGHAADTPRQPYDDELLSGEEEDSYPADPGDQPPRSRPRRWGVALAAGPKAAAWWLGRRSGCQHQAPKAGERKGAVPPAPDGPREPQSFVAQQLPAVFCPIPVPRPARHVRQIETARRAGRAACAAPS